MDFSIRSYKKELLDLDDIPFDAIKKNMDELEFINKYLGGHQITIEGFKKLLGNKKEITICEIGCGAGDNLMALYKWCKKKNIAARFIGIDINPNCIAIAKSKCDFANFSFSISDYRDFIFLDNKPDIIFSSLFCHHFTNEELVFMLRWMMNNSSAGIFINDLHRHLLAYHSIHFLTKIFSDSYLVKNDAPLSVLRGFTKKDWELILQKAGFNSYSLKWKWAFRWLLVIKRAI
ncbi:MAG TPA: methyltransferase domain-containing protein [Puia sp.]|jgi:2-polyprenyl-3-methyl-5-hydroxy-6-metoxy-1,4-benzoquinol methylase|nr:methyltransferase domain-containing protein [Puia sp.]